MSNRFTDIQAESLTNKSVSDTGIGSDLDNTEDTTVLENQTNSNSKISIEMTMELPCGEFEYGGDSAT